jgi:type IV secretory pathway VirJ component
MMAALAIAVGTVLVPSRPASALETGNLGHVHEFNPGSAMRGLVVIFSDAHGWASASDDAAIALTREGAFVVGIDLPDYLARLDAHSGEACHDVVGDIDSISRQVQRERGTAQYLTPILAGIGEGGALAPAILARAPAATIAGAVSYDPTVAVHTQIPLCSTPGANTDPHGGFVYGPWPSLPGFWAVAFPIGSDAPGRQRIEVLKAAGTPVDIESHASNGAAEALAAMIRPLLTPAPTPTTTGIGKLPLVELPAEQRGPVLAIVLSGDGGWRDLDKSISDKLQSAGVSVVGWDSLRYFWNRKSPEQVARDLGTIIDTFLSRWGGSKVVLVGYSFGADVLPFAYDYLSPEIKAHVVQLSLLGFATAADFEIRVAGLVGAGPSSDALPTEPALAPIDPTMIQCFYGADEDDTACRLLQGKAEVIRTTGGHHFDGNYGALAQRILDGLRHRAGL